MNTPFVRDPKPISDRLCRLLDDRRTVTSELAHALRCALSTCAEHQQLALIAEEQGRSSDLSRGADIGRLEMANRVVRAVAEGLEGLSAALERIPTGVDPALLELLDDLTDPDDCWFDHHGYCQAHGWFGTEPSCAHARAKKVLAAANPTPDEKRS